MSNALHTFFNRVKTLRYSSGGYQESEHENLIETLLNESGFVLSSVTSVSKKERNEDIIPGLNDGEYIPQPCGRNDSPDFIVRYGNKNYYIECKSTKGSAPTYNGGMPKKNYIYILTSQKYDETTFFYGCDVLRDDKRGLYEELLNELSGVLDKYRSMEEWKNDDRGFDFYIRSMYTQSGGAEKTDYFTHSNRVAFEQRVLESLND